MVMDSYGVNIREYLANAKSSKPPYDCPYPECERLYKTYVGIKAHLYNFDHKTGTPINHDRSSTSRSNDRKRTRITYSRSPSPPDFIKTPAREALTYAEAQRMIEVEIDGQTHRININEPMNIIRVDSKNGCKLIDANDEGKDEDGHCKMEDVEVKSEPKSATKGRNSRGGKGKHRGKSKANRYTVNKRSSVVNGQTTPNKTKTKSHQDILAALPKPSFRLLTEYNPPDAPPRPTAYYRFIDKSPDELDEEIEYDMDEEDCAWLDLINAKRKGDSSSEVQPDTFELLMDRLEKESYFCSQNSGKDMGPTIDEDAVCCICSDGECQNTNAILFCDMCNLAVHQECYGVPYIPEGQWLCRRCLQSPSRAVDCVLCPNKGGAFKQTDDNRWAHVVCALWIPEVCFANTVFLEPIDSIQNIPPARWKLTCSICKQKNAGACIQCHKNNCYVAFHVTCAQQAGLYMKMEAIKEMTSTGVSTTVRKAAFCLTHTPTDENGVSLSGVYISGEDEDSRSSLIKKPQNDAIYREKMSKARKMLAEKRSVLPVVSIPTIPLDKLNKIASLVNIPKRNQFIQRLLGYWTLKRSSRNGVPLLRRLQISYAGARKGNDLNDSDEQAIKYKEELKYLQKLRQNLEKARLLVELIRKREKLKLEFIKVHQLIIDTTFQPPSLLLNRILTRLQAKDVHKVFAKPVDIEEVPDYLDFIKNPMDLSTMKSKIEKDVYRNYTQFESDFNLMIENCMTYNNEGTYYYKAAVKLRDACKPILTEAKVAMDMRSNPKIFKDHARNLESNSSLPGQASSSSRSSSVLSSAASAASSPSVSLSSQKASAGTRTCGAAFNSTLTQIDESVEDVKPAKEISKTPNSRKRPPKKSGASRAKRAASKDSNRSGSEAPCSSPFSSALPQTDSFKVYRSNLQSASDSDINSESSQSSLALTGSTVYSSSSRSWSSGSTVSDDTKAESELPNLFQMRPTSRSSRSDISTTDSQCLIPLEPLDLVWAKCRGYPWYPALIVNPEMPKTGYFHNGVPIPVPPDEVLVLRNEHVEPVYLVLFFDAKRTWQWLPRNKLEPLGVDSDLDQVKLTESKKPAERKAVKKAYEKAILHRCRVTGQSTDISGDSVEED